MEPTWRQAEGKDAELEQAASPAEAEKLPVRSVDGNIKICIPEVNGSRPVPGADGVTHILGRFHQGYRGELHSTSLRLMTGLILPFFFFTRNMLLMKLGGGGNRGTSLMAPFTSIASTSRSMKWLFVPCDGVKKPTPGQASGGGDVKGGQ
jgi:hypothetical protein